MATSAPAAATAPATRQPPAKLCRKARIAASFEVGDVLISGSEDHRPRGFRVRQQGCCPGGQGSRGGHGDGGLEGVGWHVVVRVAVGQAQGAKPVAVPGREHLGHGAPGVMSHQIYRPEVGCLAESLDHVGQGTQAEVLVRRRGGPAVQRQVNGHAPW
jgi:hypothetical protein